MICNPILALSWTQYHSELKPKACGLRPPDDYSNFDEIRIVIIYVKALFTSLSEKVQNPKWQISHLLPIWEGQLPPSCD